MILLNNVCVLMYYINVIYMPMLLFFYCFIYYLTVIELILPVILVKVVNDV